MIQFGATAIGAPDTVRCRVASEDGQYFTVVEYHAIAKDKSGKSMFGDYPHCETTAGHEVHKLAENTYVIVRPGLIVRKIQEACQSDGQSEKFI